MKKSQKNFQGKTIAKLVIALVMVIFGSILFVGAVAGWFDHAKVVLDPEYYGEATEFQDLTADSYNELTRQQKSFMILVDQNGCTTADRLREYANRYMQDNGIIMYKMMFPEVKKSTLHEQVKYYPSVVIMDKGKIKAFLRADSDADAEAYNDYADFVEWIDKYLELVENS